MVRALSSSEYSTMVGKKINSDLQCSDYWEMHFVKLLPPWYDLITSPTMWKNPPRNLSHKICLPPMKSMFWEKVPLTHTLGGRRWRHH